MPPRQLLLIRHAQAQHNVAEDYSILDAPLTLLGRTQAAQFPHALPDVVYAADVVVSSPLRRTIQTTLGAFASRLDEKTRERHLNAIARQFERGLGEWDVDSDVVRAGAKKPPISRQGRKELEIVLLPRLQECSGMPCDTGIGLPDLLSSNDGEFSTLDMTPLEREPEWTSKKGDYGISPDEIAARATWVRKWLRDRSEEVVAIVSHGDFLRALGEIGIDQRWDNAECRAFEFVDPSGKDEQAKIRRTDDGNLAKVIKPSGAVDVKPE